jgi:hypothetical protein
MVVKGRKTFVFYMFEKNRLVPNSVADPDPLVRGMDPDPDPSIIMQK